MPFPREQYVTIHLSQPGLVKMILDFAKPWLWLVLREPPGREQLNTHLKTSVLKTMEIWSSLTSSSASPVQLSRTEAPERLLVVYLESSPPHLRVSNSHCL